MPELIDAQTVTLSEESAKVVAPSLTVEEALERVGKVELRDDGQPILAPCKHNKIECPPPGIYTTYTMEEYHSIDAYNASTGKAFLKSGEHGKAYLSEKQNPPSNDMLIGTAGHSRVMEPDDYKERAELGFGSGGKPLAAGCSWTTHKACQDKNPDKIILHVGWEERIEQMHTAIMNHNDGKHLFADPNMLREVSLIWHEPYEIAGRKMMIPCKARLDLFSPLGQCIPDLKVTVDASPRIFMSNSYKFGYHQSGGLYKQGSWRCGLLRKRADGTLPPQPYLMMGVESKPITEHSKVHLAALYVYTDADLDQGFNDLMEIGMDRYLKYRIAEFVEGPMYHDGQREVRWTKEIMPASVPDWAKSIEQPKFLIGAES